MAEFPYLPLWTDSYLADTAHLTEVEHGRYLLLLMLIWRSPQCRIPSNEKWIAQRFRRSVEEYRSEIKPIIEQFCKTTGNYVTQKRLLEEYQKAIGRRHKGRLGGEAKNRTVSAKPLKNNNQDAVPSSANPIPISKTKSISTMSEMDFCSDDGRVFIAADQIAKWEQGYPSIKNIRGRLRNAFRQWLTDTDSEQSIYRFEKYLAKIAENGGSRTNNVTPLRPGDPGYWGSQLRRSRPGR